MHRISNFLLTREMFHTHYCKKTPIMRSNAKKHPAIEPCHEENYYFSGTTSEPLPSGATETLALLLLKNLNYFTDNCA